MRSLTTNQLIGIIVSVALLISLAWGWFYGRSIHEPSRLKPSYDNGRLAINPKPNYEHLHLRNWPKKRALATVP